jgi:hypothetical protein
MPDFLGVSWRPAALSPVLTVYTPDEKAISNKRGCSCLLGEGESRSLG